MSNIIDIIQLFCMYRRFYVGLARVLFNFELFEIFLNNLSHHEHFKNIKTFIQIISPNFYLNNMKRLCLLNRNLRFQELHQKIKILSQISLKQRMQQPKD